MGTSSLILVLVMTLSALTAANNHCLTEERHQESQESIKEEIGKLKQHQEHLEKLLHSLTESVNLILARLPLEYNDTTSDSPMTTAITKTELIVESPMKPDITEKELQEIYAAAHDGDLDYINAKIEEENTSSRRLSSLLNWHNKDQCNQTALHAAIEGTHVAVILALLKAGANPNAKACGGSTPVYYVSWLGNTEILRAMLQSQYQVNVNQKEFRGSTSLHEAARMGHTEFLEVLIAHGGNVHITDDFGLTPLMRASQQGHVETVQALINAGARVTDASSNTRTALHYAALSNRPDVARLLLQNGASKWQKAEGNTPAEDARQDGHDEIADLIDNWQ